MSAFINFQNKELKFIGMVSSRGNAAALHNTMVTEEKITLNILGLSTKLSPIEKIPYHMSFWDIFINDDFSGNTFEKILSDTLETFKTFPEVLELFEKYIELIESYGSPTHINWDKFNTIANNLTQFIDGNYSSLYDNIITIDIWELPVYYSNVIGGETLQKINLKFNSEKDAIEFRDQLMYEIEDFYKNFASYVKFMVLK